MFAGVAVDGAALAAGWPEGKREMRVKRHGYLDSFRHGAAFLPRGGGRSEVADRVADVYFPRARAEHLIAVWRLFLASLSFLAVLVDPTAPPEYNRIVHALLGGYVSYALLMMALAGRRQVPPRHPLAGHVVDLVAVLVCSWVSAGSNSPLFSFFVFILLAASLRWQRQGTLWSAVAVLSGFMGMGAYDGLAHPEAFEVNVFVIRGACLVVTAVLLAEIGVYEQQARGEMQRLSSEPDLPLGNIDAFLRGLLEWAASIMRDRRAVIAWEEQDEPWLHVAWWQRGEFEYVREPPGIFEPLVADDLADASFLCHDADAPGARVLRTTSAGFDWWHGDAVHPKFRERFSITSVLSMPVRADAVNGRLFFVDRADTPRMTSDDLVMGNIIAHRVGHWLSRIQVAQRLAQVATLEQRIRVARDLHDGAFHSLTGVALELERLLRMPASEFAGAQERLREVQQSLADGQRTLRMLISGLRRPVPLSPQPDVGLEARLKDLCRRVERQWRLRVEASVTGLDRVRADQFNDVYFIVHEALVNVARHAGASVARMEVAGEGGTVRIVVGDDGHGFSFKGRYDHPALAARDLGPATLKDRAALLGGAMSIDSSDSGTRLEITFPVGSSGQ